MSKKLLFPIALSLTGSAGYNSQNPSCTSDIVERAGSDGFVKYVLTNCLTNTVTGLNWKGEETKDQFECLADWIDEHSNGDSTIPVSGACRDAFQYLLQTLVSNPNNSVNLIETNGCSYNLTTDELLISDTCLHYIETNDLGSYGTPFGLFYLNNGPGINGPNCSSSEVRQLSIRNNEFSAIVKIAAVNGLYTFAEMDTYSINGFCGFCYRGFFSDVTGLSSYTTTKAYTVCQTTPLDPECFDTTAVQDALANFQICSGGIDVQFQGSVCTSEEVAQVESLIPAPYFTLTQCSIFPQLSYCLAIQSYMDEISIQSDTSCYFCYDEFKTSVDTLISHPAVLMACTQNANANSTTDPIFSDACTTALASPLFEFQTCSGAKMNTSSAVLEQTTTTTLSPQVNNTIIAISTTEFPPSEESVTTTTATPMNESSVETTDTKNAAVSETAVFLWIAACTSLFMMF